LAVSKRLWFQRLNLKYDGLLSSFAFTFNAPLYLGKLDRLNEFDTALPAPAQLSTARPFKSCPSLSNRALPFQIVPFQLNYS
jgi:hypothetical protein